MRGIRVRSSQGFALIVVAWFLVLTAAIATYMMENARTETAIARNVVAAASAEALADAAIAQTIFNQSNEVEADRWKRDGEPHVIALLGGQATIRVYDETKKINPNLASPALIAALFEAAGVARSSARDIGAAIADWVDRDMAPVPYGAEAIQYTRAGRSYAPPNVPIESLDELQLVLGVTPERLALVLPYLTLHTKSEQPEATNAPPVVQRALLLLRRSPTSGPDAANVAAAPQGGTLTADERAAEEEGGATAQATAPQETGQPAQAQSAEQAAQAERIIEVNIVARSSNGGIFVRDAVLRLDSMSAKGYAVLAWSRGDLVETSDN
jgi:general secretion pathway protein K